MTPNIFNPYRYVSGGIDDDQLKCYYKFDNASGDVPNLSESSEDLGSGADQQVSGGATYEETGIIDYALGYDGVDSYSRAGSSLSQFNFCHETGHQWTLNFWLLRNAEVTGGHVIMGTSGQSDATTTGFLIGASTYNKMYLALNDGEAGQPIDDYYLPSNFIGSATWEMFTITYDDPSQEAIVYRDFDSITPVTIGYSLASRTTGNATAPMTSATNPDDNASNWFAGRLDEVSFWDRILTSDEIEALYNSGLGLAIY